VLTADGVEALRLLQVSDAVGEEQEGSIALAGSGYQVYQVCWRSAQQEKRQWLGIFINGLYRPYPCQWPASWAKLASPADSRRAGSAK
jgi:hypothetical protein